MFCVCGVCVLVAGFLGVFFVVFLLLVFFFFVARYKESPGRNRFPNWLGN